MGKDSVLQALFPLPAGALILPRDLHRLSKTSSCADTTPFPAPYTF